MFYVLIKLISVHIGYRVSMTNIWARCQNKHSQAFAPIIDPDFICSLYLFYSVSLPLPHPLMCCMYAVCDIMSISIVTVNICSNHQSVSGVASLLMNYTRFASPCCETLPYSSTKAFANTWTFLVEWP